MPRVLFAKVGLSAFILFIGTRAILALRPRDDLDPQARCAVVLSATVCTGNIAFLAFAYLAAGFSTLEAATATSFWRYMCEVGPLAALGVVAGVPLGWMRRLTSVPVMVVLVALALVLPVATVKLYRFDLESPVPRLHQMAQAVDAAVPLSAALQLLDLTGNGFAPLVMYYDLVLSGHDQGLSTRTVTRLSGADGISAQEAARTDFSKTQYTWLAEGAPEMAGIFGPRLSARCSYLLKREPSGFSVMARWPIGPYRWGSYRHGWSDGADSSCE